MAVKAGTIENREQDLTIDNRVVSGGRPEKLTAEERLKAINQRVAAALNTDPVFPKKTSTELCRECYREGQRDAFSMIAKLLQE